MESLSDEQEQLNRRLDEEGKRLWNKIRARTNRDGTLGMVFGAVFGLVGTNVYSRYLDMFKKRNFIERKHYIAFPMVSAAAVGLVAARASARNQSHHVYYFNKYYNEQQQAIKEHIAEENRAAGPQSPTTAYSFDEKRFNSYWVSKLRTEDDIQSKK